MPCPSGPQQESTALDWSSRLPMQTVPNGVDGSHDLPNPRVGRWATHEVANPRCPASPHMAPLQSLPEESAALSRSLQSTAVAQSVAHGHVAAFDSFRRLLGRLSHLCGRREGW